jgi:hypothetical protein
MDILAKLRRIVEEYRKKHHKKPGRIVLKGEAIKAMADYISEQEHEKNQRSGADLRPFSSQTKDEKFLDGGMFYFKFIPVIAELEPELELIVE